MDFAAYDFGASGDHGKGEHASQNQQHSIDGAVDFFSFADVPHDYHANNDPTTMNMDYSQDLGSSFTMAQFGDHDAQQLHNNIMLQGHGHVGHSTQYDMSPAHTPLNRPHGMGSMFGEDEDFFSPLLSPAIGPSSSSASYQPNNTIEPLTSPALHSQQQGMENVLQQRLDMIEHQQQQLRSAHPHIPANVHTTTTTTTTTTSVSTETATYPRKLAPSTSSKASNNDNNNDNAFIAPATPSLLMRLGQQGGKTNDMTSNNNNTTTPKITAQHQPPPTSAISSSSSVDNMASLPAAMLEMRPMPTRKQSLPATSKRRRISRTSAAFTSPALAPTTMHISPRVHPTTTSGTDPTIAALVSPAALRPQASTASPRALKPLISPSLKPNGKRLTAIDEEVAAAALASKSNYQNMREGKAKSLGIEFSTSFQSGVENRRSAHKAAEQKRRDTLKQSFDALRKEIADALVEQQQQEGEEEPTTGDDQGGVQERRESKEKEVKQMSKVVLIQHSYEYILRLKEENRRKDQEMACLQQELDSLRKQLDSSK
ncbi:hypothetical protein K492DRAFT_209079 [Lichtheimia hyalospora FSU 10163]|nr:hypothetical protein K492DRAFT_209079 [Lichtheimia hyalospora FSU 10163]